MALGCRFCALEAAASGPVARPVRWLSRIACTVLVLTSLTAVLGVLHAFTASKCWASRGYRKSYFQDALVSNLSVEELRAGVGRWWSAKGGEDSSPLGLSYVCEHAAPCIDESWEAFRNSCYLYICASVDYKAAKLGCADRGAWLVSIAGPSQNRVVQGLCGRKGCWIGLSVQTGSLEWTWEDGMPLGGPGADGGNSTGYVNWWAGEPSSGGWAYLNAADTTDGITEGRGRAQVTAVAYCLFKVVCAAILVGVVWWGARYREPYVAMLASCFNGAFATFFAIEVVLALLAPGGPVGGDEVIPGGSPGLYASYYMAVVLFGFAQGVLTCAGAWQARELFATLIEGEVVVPMEGSLRGGAVEVTVVGRPVGMVEEEHQERKTA
mmetsp:Transcript_58683/g.128864  ORF Transcript_58683/g.128864 Transcript_58683/m.128864 type:complete len:381 (-) Transcript_58683:39-1181(-)